MVDIVIGAVYTVFCFDTMMSILQPQFENVRGIRRGIWDSIETVMVLSDGDETVWVQENSGAHWFIPKVALKQRIA